MGIWPGSHPSVTAQSTSCKPLKQKHLLRLPHNPDSFRISVHSTNYTYNSTALNYLRKYAEPIFVSLLLGSKQKI